MKALELATLLESDTADELLCQAYCDHMIDAAAELRRLAAVEAELERIKALPPAAWRTFDGEGGYDYRTYEMNESYAEDYAKRNPNHAHWVDPLIALGSKTNG